jgi:hypothetical protein
MDAFGWEELRIVRGLRVRGGSAVEKSGLLLEDGASLAVFLETQFAFGEASLE